MLLSVAGLYSAAENLRVKYAAEYDAAGKENKDYPDLWERKQAAKNKLRAADDILQALAEIINEETKRS